MESHSRPHSPVPAGLPCIPTHSSAPTVLRCCCGRNECAFLHNNNLALEGLEKDLETAARLGQALLHRHESYMAEAEEDRKRFLTDIENLEREKRQVQAENARIIEENRGLLEQLDGLNKAVAASDAHAESLAATLEHTEAELRQVTASAARAADLEAQLARMEAEQSRLQDSLQIVQEDEKSAVQRWKKAECTLRDLHDQVDRIEKEAREERERHAELVQRMERRRAVERELDGAAGRLKGAAAAQELGRNRGNPNVVSRFVRDILQDNAHLQMGIIELREMLESSNQEVQNLRDQVLSHRPLTADNEDDEGRPRPPPTTLNQELEPKESRRVSSEFHIHHHYHSPSIPASSKKDKGTIFRRSKKRRSLGNTTVMHSASSSQISRRSMHQPQSSTSSTSTILSQTSVSIPPPAASRRWSFRSPAAESLASSPQSGYRTSSIFDRVERGSESSQPSSPESTALSSPVMKSRHKHVPFDVPFRALDGMDESERVDSEESTQLAYDYFGQRNHGELSDRMPFHSIIPEEMEDSLSTQYGESAPNQPSADPDDVFSTPQSPLMRRQSHESLFSIAGMDIHTPSRRPSRMSDLHSSLPIRTPRRIISPSAELFAPSPVISTSTVTAGREPPKTSEHSPRRLLATVAASRARAEDTPSVGSADSGSSVSTVTPSRKSSLSRRVGGWVRGRWGIAPTSSNGDTESRAGESDMLAAAAAESPVSSRPSSAGKQKRTSSFDPMPNLRYRFPGVNQSGPILGFRPPPQAPVSLHPEQLDENLLRESLAE